MSTAPPSSLIRSMKSFSRAAGIIAILVGLLVFAGWAESHTVLKGIFPGLITMKVNTALGFVVAGIGLWFSTLQGDNRARDALLQGSAFLTALIGLATLAEYIFHWQLGIDQLLFQDVTPNAITSIPGRMSPTSAVNFLLLGAGLLYLERETPLGDRLAQALSLLIFLLSGLAVLGYSFEAWVLFGSGHYNHMAVHAALTFMILATGLLFTHPQRGPVAIFVGEQAGSLMARRLLPAAIMLPVLLGWLSLQGQRAGHGDPEISVTIMVASSVTVFVLVIMWNAYLLNQTDSALKTAQAADLRESEERLRYVVWATRDAVWDRNLASGEIWWNEGLQKLFHYRPGEIEATAAWWEEHIHPDDRARVMRSITSILETRQELWSKEYRFRRNDGSYANIFDRGYIIYHDQTGEPLRMIGAMADMSDQKQIEQALRQSEELFAKAFSATPAGIILTQISDGQFVEVNDAYLKLIGYSRGEILGQTALDLQIISPDDQGTLLKLFAKQGFLHNFEAWVRTKSGEHRAVLSSLEQVEVGGIACILSVIYDITERKEGERALQESEEKWRRLFDILPVGVSVLDGAATILEMNAALQSILRISKDSLGTGGYKKRQYLNGKGEPILPRELPSTRAMELQEIVKDVEICVIMEDGNAIWTNVSAAPLSLADARAVIVTTDITARKQAEDAQQRSEELFRALFELSPDSVLLIDPHDPNVSWPIVDCNAAACQINGYTREELIGHSIDILNGNVALPAERQAYMKRLREHGGHLKAEHLHLHKSGHWFSIEAATTLIRIAGRELIIGIDRDITARKQAAEELRDANEKLARGLEQVQERNREGVLLNELGYLLQSSETAEDAYAAISRSAAQLFPNAKGSIFIRGSTGELLVPVVSWNTGQLDAGSFAPEDCLALREDQTHLVDREYQNLQCDHITGSPTCSICIPLRDEHEVLGIFHLQCPADQPLVSPRAGYDDFSQPEQRLAMTVADTISLALSNLRLRETLRSQAIRDPLTGLYNRRFLEESLERELSRAQRNGRPVGVIMLDLDHFKLFNDTFGHPAGDLVLRELAGLLQSSIRFGDIACRYGGEEFLLLLPEASLEITRQRAKKIWGDVRRLQVEYRGQKMGLVTASLGVALFPDHGQTAADVIRAADQALYRAKRAGRDRVTSARSKK